ncbi:MAG: beta-Ala-His dipeptidase [Marinomonadaceae bacterium]
MSKKLITSGLEPSAVWQNFERLSQIPRGSGKEERIRAYVQGFAAALNLDTSVDLKGNIVIHKPATKGMENRETVALQCHLDMVQQKDEDRVFDFDRDPIELILEGDWLSAKGTTLGADNGIGIALIMAILASKDIAHSAIEALFTLDEEVGMSGAEAVTADQLTAPFLINLDMESDHELTIGCAGAVDIVTQISYQEEPLIRPVSHYEIQVSGGLGGHSGLDIHHNRMNAIKVLALALEQLSKVANVNISSLIGGGAANVIPRQAKAYFSVPAENLDALHLALETLSEFVTPYKDNEPNVVIVCNPSPETPTYIWQPEFQMNFLSAINSIKNGVYSMSPDIDGLVETSNSLSIIQAEKGQAKIICLARTCIENHKESVIQQIESSFSDLKADIILENDAPGWEPISQSILLTIMSDAYEKIHGQKPGVIAIHAGLETGILSNTFPNTQMVSYGPNIMSAHSTQERVQISSVQKVWPVLIETLSSIPVKKGEPA